MMTRLYHAWWLIAAMGYVCGSLEICVASASEQSPDTQPLPPQLRITSASAPIPDAILDHVRVLAKIDDEVGGRYTRDKQHRWEAEFAKLTHSEQASAETLVQMLGNKDPYARACAANALGVSEEKRSVDALVATLHDDDLRARCCAALALGRIRHHRALPELIKALEDEDHSFRRQVATALGHIGSAEATKALITAIKVKFDGRSCDIYAPIVVAAMWQEAHPDSYNEPSSWALTRIGPPAVKDLAAALNDPAGTNHAYIAWSLGMIALQHRDAAAIQSLVAARDHTDKNVRELVAETLKKIDDSKE